MRAAAFRLNDQLTEMRGAAEKVCSGPACLSDAIPGQKFCQECRESFLEREMRRFQYNPKGWVYFIQDTRTDHIKIGFTHDVQKRMSQLQTASSAEYVLLSAMQGSTRKEAALHEFFAHARVRGEWFEATDELCELIAMCVEKERSNDVGRFLSAANAAGLTK